MSGSNGIKLSVGGLILYLCIAVVFMIIGDHDNALAVLGGALLWCGCIFVWHKVKRRDDSNK